jgi:hypothetical protein
MTLFFLPFLLISRRKALPYLVATLSHSLIGDMPFGDIRLLWPLSSWNLGLGETVMVNSSLHISLEYVSWIVALVLLIKMDILGDFVKPLKSNLLMAIPLSALLFTFLLAPKAMTPIPVEMVLLHMTVLPLFFHSTLLGIRATLNLRYEELKFNMKGRCC